MKLAEVSDAYIAGKYAAALKAVTALEDDMGFISKPDGLGDYKRCINALVGILEKSKAIGVSYSIDEIHAKIRDGFKEAVIRQKDELKQLNAKYEGMIEDRIREIKEEAAKKKEEAISELNRANQVYVDLENKRKQLEGYSDKIVELCSRYGVVTGDINVSTESFTIEELDALYDYYIQYMESPGQNRENPIRLFREKFPDMRVQGAVVLVCLLFSFTLLLDILAVIGFAGIVYSQVGVQKKVKFYSLLLGLIYNVHPLDMGFKDKPDGLSTVADVDMENDERIKGIGDAWAAELAKLGENNAEEQEQGILRELVNKSAEIEKEFSRRADLIKQRVSEFQDMLAKKIKSLKEEFEKAKKEVRLLGEGFNKSVVFNTKYKIGLKDSIIEESVDIGLSNVIIRPCKDLQLQKEFLQVMLANALCNVKARNLSVVVYDPNNFGQDLVSFYDSELEEILIFLHDGLSKIISELREFAMQSMKEMKGKDINEFNKEAEQLGKVEKDYRLLIVLSQPKSIEEDEALTSFMEYSARMGVFVWLLSNKTMKNTYVFEKPFGNTANPYHVDTNTFGLKVAKNFIEEMRKNKVTILPWKEYIKIAVPDAKIWSYSGDEFIDLNPGLENGDPSKTQGYTVGNVGDIHAIAAGRTGAGKSAFLNNMIATMCQKYSPEELELWLIDYKCTEFSFFLPKPGVQEFTFPQIKTCLCTTDGDYAESVYSALSAECERRFKVFAEVGVKNLKQYNQLMVQQGTPENRMPRMLFINDEFQVIFEKAKDAILTLIQKSLVNVAKLGRAAGVHLFFTSQSMKKTVSADVLAQFTLRFALKCDDTVSTELLGTTKASKMKEPIGYCIVRSGKDVSLDAQKKYKIPLIENEDLLELMKKLWELQKQKGITPKDIITYDETKKHSIDELKEWWTANESIVPDSGLIILGNRMTYSMTNKAPENILLSAENNSHIMSAFGDNDDLVDFYKQILCNLSFHKQKPMIFINSQVESLHYVCAVENDVAPDMLEMSTNKTDIYKLYKLFEGIFNTRQALHKKDDPFYAILIGWDKAVGFGVDRDTDLVSAFSSLLKQCGEYNMHFIFINSMATVAPSLIGSCKFRICGKCDEASSYSLIETKQGSQPSELKNGYLYLKSGNELPTRAKLYLSPKEREVKKSTFIMGR